MKLAIIDLNKGQVPATIKEGLELCSIFSRKDIVQYLTENEGGMHKVNTNGFVFAFCEAQYKKENQERVSIRGAEYNGAEYSEAEYDDDIERESMYF